MGGKESIRCTEQGVPRFQTDGEGTLRDRGQRVATSATEGIGRDFVPTRLFNGRDLIGRRLNQLRRHARVQTLDALHGANAESDAARDHLQMALLACI